MNLYRKSSQTGAGRVLIALLVLLFAGYYVNTTMFWHSHIVNGTVVIHSHIHSEGHHQTSAGGHSEASLLTIDSLHSELLTLGVEHVVVTVPLERSVVVFVAAAPQAKLQPSLPLFSLRAPPLV